MENESIIHISLTGHRPKKLGRFNLNTPAYRKLQKDLETYIERCLDVYHIVVGHSGLALGADTVWSKAILAMRDKYPDRVRFHAEIPMMEQSEMWISDSDKRYWQEQVNRADDHTVYGSLAKWPDVNDPARKREAVRLMDMRNHGMLDAANILLALYDGTSGGTNNAVQYAKKIGLHTAVVHPDVYFA